ncbi:MAG TPA: SUF system NifU family Fe-S cluster assembly protein [Candidatus Acidoferrales bacterium]|nr:SUF system NifU family Fe-S cluster assembly protein [Candidatus Acidoferrales bacterium]
MSDLSDLYQEVILDHNKRPRNFQKLETANRTAEGFNPLCGDQITVYLLLEGDVIKDIAFQGSGCAISKASASMMTAALKGKSRQEGEALFDKVHQMLTGKAPANPEELGRLAALSGVCNFPARVKCASLAWHTLRAALEDRRQRVSTE